MIVEIFGGNRFRFSHPTTDSPSLRENYDFELVV